MTCDLSDRFGARIALAVVAALAVTGAAVRAQNPARFRTGVELVNVTATVTDPSGRFVRGLTQGDFRVFEDDRPVDITHFNSDRVPVSLGIVLDTSGSMAGQKMAAARAALDRFLFQLLGSDDEVFLYRFATAPQLVHSWTTDRIRIRSELERIKPDGATALYDTIAAALPLLHEGHHRKKALLVISDGLDTSSQIDRDALKRLIRESEAVVYAIGMEPVRPPARSRGDGDASSSIQYQRGRLPFPFPGGRGGPRNPGGPPVPAAPRWPPPKTGAEEPETPDVTPDTERVDAAALREITDDSGGRTEILRDARDLDPTTAGIADELSRQYFLGYASPGHHDGRWHTIRVETRDPSLRVRARRGYLAPI
jgi:VWFA-related protein